MKRIIPLFMSLFFSLSPLYVSEFALQLRCYGILLPVSFAFHGIQLLLTSITDALCQFLNLDESKQRLSDQHQR